MTTKTLRRGAGRTAGLVKDDNGATNASPGGRLALDGEPAKEVDRDYEVPKLEIGTVHVCLVGDSDLLINRMSEKVRQAIAAAQAEKKAPVARKARNPKAEYNDARYRMPNDSPYDGVRAVGIKKAMVAAIRHLGKKSGMTMKGFQGVGFAIGEGPEQLIAIKELDGTPKKPYMHEAPVRLKSGGADLRYRPCYTAPWRIDVPIRYAMDCTTPNQIMGLLERAGFQNGLGEDRPEKTGGTYGMFHVATAEDLKQDKTKTKTKTKTKGKGTVNA